MWGLVAILNRKGGNHRVMLLRKQMLCSSLSNQVPRSICRIIVNRMDGSCAILYNASEYVSRPGRISVKLLLVVSILTLVD